MLVAKVEVTDVIGQKNAPMPYFLLNLVYAYYL